MFPFVEENKMLRFDIFQLAEEQTAIVVAQVHAPTLAVTPHVAVGTGSCLFPRTVAEQLETVLPDIPEIVAVDISLMVVGTDAAASRDASVVEHGAYGDTGLAEEGTVAHVELMTAEESLAAVFGFYAGFATCLINEIHQLVEVFVSELQFGILCRASDRKDGDEPPLAHTLGDEKFLQLGNLVEVVLGDAGDDVEDDALLGHEGIDGLGGSSEALRVAAHPVMVLLQSIETHGHTVQTTVV